MKQILTQYLSSLKESGELDAILPDILQECGFSIVSTPQKGAKQYGVDLSVVGSDPKSKRNTLYLITVKSGDLSKYNWNSGQNAVKQSLDQIFGTYVKHFIPVQFQDIPIKVVLCIGGMVQQSIRLEVNDYCSALIKNSQVSIIEWNGEAVADMIVSGLMNESIFTSPFKSAFRKSVAMIEEPDTCLRYFSELLYLIYKKQPKTTKDCLLAARQVYLATWVIYSWCRDIKNLESAYKVCSLATLHFWHWSKPMFGKTKLKSQLTGIMQSILDLNIEISSSYINHHIGPYSGSTDLLSESVNSPVSVDINLKLFEALGRVSLYGLWLQCRRIWLNPEASNQIEESFSQELDLEIQKISKLLSDMISNNLTLHSPIRDDHAIEITLTGLFFRQNDELDSIKEWIKEITVSSIVNHKTNQQYPCTLKNYRELVKHPVLNEEYKKKVTIGSILYPTLAVWLAITEEVDTFQDLENFLQDFMKHSTWQLWVPDDFTEHHLYLNSDLHGKCVSGINLSNGKEALIEQLEYEIEQSQEFNKLSPILLNHWPIVLMACRQYRLPIPIHFWSSDHQNENSI